MCGIGAFSLCKEDHGRIDITALSNALFKHLTPRGRDASGAAWTAEGGVWWHKAPVLGTAYRCPIDPTATTAILHTRAATSGDPADNANNHPHVLPGVTGVHNGIIRNHRELIASVGAKPQSECDSEGIFALLAYGEGNRTDLLPTVKGDAAIAWLETETPTSLRLARLNGRPMAVGQTRRGSTIMASTPEILRRACAEAQVTLAEQWDVAEWTYMRVQHGVIHDVFPMVPPVREPSGYRLGEYRHYERTGFWRSPAEGRYPARTVTPRSAERQTPPMGTTYETRPQPRQEAAGAPKAIPPRRNPPKRQTPPLAASKRPAQMTLEEWNDYRLAQLRDALERGERVKW